MKLSTHTALLALVFGLSLCLPAAAADKSAAVKGSLAKEDAQRLEKMAQADMAEVAAGKVASSKGTSAEVRKYGQHMVDEHSKMLDEGGKLAKSKGVEPPASPDKKHQDALKKLEGMSGEQFDRAYMSQMVSDHKEALNLVKDTESKAKDGDLKALAQKARPRVEEHLKMAQDISARLSSGTTSKSDKSK